MERAGFAQAACANKVLLTRLPQAERQAAIHVQNLTWLPIRSQINDRAILLRMRGSHSSADVSRAEIERQQCGTKLAFAASAPNSGFGLAHQSSSRSAAPSTEATSRMRMMPQCNRKASSELRPNRNKASHSMEASSGSHRVKGPLCSRVKVANST